MTNLERELKLVPENEALLDELALVERLGPFVARGRGRELQHNSFFDTANHALRKARVGFRRRSIEGQKLAAWTIKGDARQIGAMASRSEIELLLDPDMAPALALSTLRDTAASRGASALADAVAGALAAGGPPLGKPILETRTDRRIVNLEVPGRDWQVELALDRMEVVDHAYRDVEIEAELKRGDEAALAEVESAIRGIGKVHESKGSKLGRAQAHVESCNC
jgi:inorganic triphosphatase YgiF